MEKDPKLTQQLKDYLEAPEESRDLSAGNLLLLKFSGNRIAYNMIARNPAKYAKHIQIQLQKYYNFRVREITHEQVEEMQKKVDKIVDDNISLMVKAASEPQAKGRREDHHLLPREIQKIYENNLKLLVQMRDIHEELRKLSLSNSPCPDSERYPFLKELIAKDKQLHENWKAYDNYKLTPAAPSEAQGEE